MIVVQGIEDAVVGWTERNGRVGVVYSADRIRINMERDGLTPTEQEVVLAALMKRVESYEGDDEDMAPIIVHTADYEELEYRDALGDFRP